MTKRARLTPSRSAAGPAPRLGASWLSQLLRACAPRRPPPPGPDPIGRTQWDDEPQEKRPALFAPASCPSWARTRTLLIQRGPANRLNFPQLASINPRSCHPLLEFRRSDARVCEGETRTTRDPVAGGVCCWQTEFFRDGRTSRTTALSRTSTGFRRRLPGRTSAAGRAARSPGSPRCGTSAGTPRNG